MRSPTKYKTPADANQIGGVNRMPKRNSTHARSIVRHWLWYGSLVCLLCLCLPEVAFASASQPLQEGPGECADCHQEEVRFGSIHHTPRIMTCEQCHGEYVQGHPQQGVMALQVDSTACQSCHSTTAKSGKPRPTLTPECNVLAVTNPTHRKPD